MALLQIQEPVSDQHNQDEDEIIVGIDLGTTNSLIAIIENEKVRILPDSKGSDIHPSVVFFDDEGRVNSSAKNKVSSIKRLMGKGFEDVDHNKFSFAIEQNLTQRETLKIVIGSRKISPAEISAEILKYLKNIAEQQLKRTVKKAVITVPAYFDEAAKNATKLAAKLADLEVVRLVNEPTAAALAYGLENSSEGIYCVYDLGGGTFDVSILKMQKGVFKVLGVAGDNHLGGDDFDFLLLQKGFTNPRQIKEELSSELTVKSEGQQISRQEFENLISPKIEKTITLTRNLLDDLELESLDIKGVILVGGSSRIPLVRQKLSEIFGAEKVLTNLDPDRVVAIGAAWQAYNLSSNKKHNEKNLLLDVVPLSLGIELMGGIVEKIILRNSTIPIAKSKEFTTYVDNQTGMKFHLVQGEREFANDCRSLAEFEIKNISPMKAGLAKVVVTFTLDADGLLTVSAQEKSSKESSSQKQEILVRPSYSLSEEAIKNMLFDSLKNSKSDIEKRLLAESINEAKRDLMIIRNDLQNPEIKILPKERESIEEKFSDLDSLIKEVEVLETTKDLREKILEKQKQLSEVSQILIYSKVNAALKEKVAGHKIDDF